MAESPGWDLGGKKGVLVMARPYTHSSPNLFGDDKMTKTNTNTNTSTNTKTTPIGGSSVPTIQPMARQ